MYNFLEPTDKQNHRLASHKGEDFRRVRSLELGRNVGEFRGKETIVYADGRVVHTKPTFLDEDDYDYEDDYEDNRNPWHKAVEDWDETDDTEVSGKRKPHLKPIIDNDGKRKPYLRPIIKDTDNRNNPYLRPIVKIEDRTVPTQPTLQFQKPTRWTHISLGDNRVSYGQKDVDELGGDRVEYEYVDGKGMVPVTKSPLEGSDTRDRSRDGDIRYLPGSRDDYDDVDDIPIEETDETDRSEISVESSGHEIESEVEGSRTKPETPSLGVKPK
jgi:hypothetical protein